MIRAYLDYALPVLAGWSQRVEFLREITRADVDTATAQLSGNAVLARRTALRSIFRSLKQERIIFHDPTRGTETLTAARSLPAPLPSRALRGTARPSRRRHGPTDRLRWWLCTPSASSTCAVFACATSTPAAVVSCSGAAAGDTTSSTSTP